MKGLVRTLFVSSLLLFGAFTASPAAADNPPTTSGAPLYLALGDSWAFGFGATVPSEGGYVPQLHQALQQGPYDCLPTAEEQAADRCKQLQLLNIAEGGETTPSMIEEQLFPVAIPLLEARNGNLNPRDDVELITLHTGGNDVFGPIIAACSIGFPIPCLPAVQSELTAYEEDLGDALGLLRDDDAAGDDTRIVIGTYDNPFRFTPCIFVSGISGAAALADIVLEGAPALGVPLGLHGIMRDVGEDHGVEVAEVYGDLNSPGDWFSSQQPPESRTDCLHPTDSGYDKVTDAFEEALGLS
jgi:lysophospholipase L1-like esterase